jgi:hypothetical protein
MTGAPHARAHAAPGRRLPLRDKRALCAWSFDGRRAIRLDDQGQRRPDAKCLSPRYRNEAQGVAGRPTDRPASPRRMQQSSASRLRRTSASTNAARSCLADHSGAACDKHGAAGGCGECVPQSTRALRKCRSRARFSCAAAASAPKRCPVVFTAAVAMGRVSASTTGPPSGGARSLRRARGADATLLTGPWRQRRRSYVVSGVITGCATGSARSSATASARRSRTARWLT